jgi:DNA-binding transcriptional LysR family regulator
LGRLEQAVGATLLETTPDHGGINLTPAGEKLANEVAPVLGMLARTGHDAAVTPGSMEPDGMPRN